MPAPNQEVWGRVDSSLSPTWFQIMTRLRKVNLFYIICTRRYNSLTFFSLPDTVYLSTLWRKEKKKVLENLQGFKKNARLPLFCNGPGCETIRLQNTGGVLRVDFSDKISLRL